MNRRDLLKPGAAAAALASPSLAHALNARTLRVVPQSDLTALDPMCWVLRRLIGSAPS